MKIVPQDFFSTSPRHIRASDLATNGRLFAAFSNQLRQLQIGRVQRLDAWYVGVILPASPLDAWYSSVIGGDSGSSVILVIDGEAVALGVWYASNLTTYSLAPNIAAWKNSIGAAILALGSDTQMSEIDLEDYAIYDT